MALEIGIKSLRLGESDHLYFWYANNAGRGRDNCTIIRSHSGTRTERSADQTEVVAATRTGAWSGQVNFSRRVTDALGIDRPASTICNSYHGTEYQSKLPRAEIDRRAGHLVSDALDTTPAHIKAWRRKVWRALCGVAGCLCGHAIGERV